MASTTTDTAAEVPTTSDVIVQYVVLRRDLIDTWPLGSVVTQGCHASVAAIWTHKDDPQTIEYCSPDNIDSMHKVTLEVKGEVQLKNLSEKLTSNNIDHKLWIEQPENYPTCLATKPYPKSLVSTFFKKLKLYDGVQEVQVPDVPPKKFKKRADKQPWSQEEEEALAKAWIHISTCRVVGNEQGRDKFWERILEHFATLMNGTTRTHHSLNTKWTTMNGSMGVFNGLYHQSHRLWESGCNDLDVLKNALADYSTKVGKPFTHQLAWAVVKDQAKWAEQKCVGGTSSSHSDKRRKSSEGGNYESASNDPNTIIPDLNDDSTPTRPRKGKKSVGETSSKAGSIVDTVQSYAERKTKVMADLTEKTLALLDIQIQQATNKAERQDFKFFMESHNDIEDPALLSWMLDKKRQLAAKYGWPCNF